MIFIVDSGSTKCDWMPVSENGNQLQEKIRTDGLNPAILSPNKLAKIISSSKPVMHYKEAVTQVFFYGAGCGTEKPRQMLKEILEIIFVNAVVEVKEDTMAAVRATLNSANEAAVVCILGTGSNCSYFDGKKLHQKVQSLGHILMDDASGNYYGKQLIRDYYFKHMPETLRIAFEHKYDLNADTIKHNLYKKPNTNAYLAQFAEFAFLNKEANYVQLLIKNGLRLFVNNMIFQYKNVLDKVPVHFAGSIAFYAQDEIKEIATEMGFMPGNFERRPIEGLLKYHTTH